MYGFQRRQTLLFLKKECNPHNVLRSGIGYLKYFMWFGLVAIKILGAPASQPVPVVEDAAFASSLCSLAVHPAVCP